MASPRAGTARQPGALPKGRATEIARQALSYGYFNLGPAGDFDGRDALTISCPRCRCEQRTCRQYRYRPARKGEPGVTEPGGRRVVFERERTNRQALIRALIEHLTFPGECPGVSDGLTEHLMFPASATRSTR